MTHQADGLSSQDFLSTLHGAPGFGAPRRAFHLSRRAKSIHEGLFSTALRGSVGFLPFALIGGGMMVTTPAQATPAGANIVSGGVTIQNTTAQRMDIVQTTSKAIIDWKSFNVGVDEHVNFDHQAGADSITLNRVTGGSASTIAGQLTALGNVWILNQNGVIFSSSARVDVGGLMATTSDIGNQDFLDGKYDFIDTGTDGSVINEGQINIKDGGLAAFVAPHVTNNGVITANLGKVALAAGHTFTVDLYGDGMIQLATSAENVPDTVSLEQSGEIYAAGGKVHLTAKAAGNLVDNIINMDGVIEATSASVGQNGQIIIHGGDNGIVAINGTLDASGKGVGETGGEVQVLGHKVGLFGNTTIDASGHSGGGEVYIGGDYQGGGTLDTAEITFVAQGAEIDVSAINNGDGGTAIMWADDATRYYGHVDAKGGANGGDGGFIEISGKQYIEFEGTVDTTAAHGKTGKLLLDPTTVNIIAGAGGLYHADLDDTGVDGSFESSNGATVSIRLGNIRDALDVTSLEILTGGVGSGAGVGDINVNTSITLLNDTGNSLTLSAYGDININNDIDLTASTEAGLVLNVGQFGGAGQINLAADITTDGGAVTFNGDTYVTGNRAITTNSGQGSVLFNGLVTNDGAVGLDNLNVNAGVQDVTFNSSVGELNSLSITSKDLVINGDVTVDPTSGNTDFTQTGTITLHGETYNFGDVATLNATDLIITGQTDPAAKVVLSARDGSITSDITVGAADTQITMGYFTGGSGLTITGDINSEAGEVNNLEVSTVSATFGSNLLDIQGTIGATNRIGNLEMKGTEIDIAQNVFTDGDVSLTSFSTTGFNIANGAGATTDIETAELNRLNVGGSLNFDSGSRGTTVGAYDFSSDVQFESRPGVITLGDIGNTKAGGKIEFVNNDERTATIGGNITTNGGDIIFSNGGSEAAIDLTGDRIFSTGAGAGNIVLSKVDSSGGARDLTLDAGVGNIEFAASLGNTSALDDLNIISGANVTVNDSAFLDVNNFNQNYAGVGATNFGLSGLRATGNLVVMNAVVTGNVLVGGSVSAAKTAYINMTGSINGPESGQAEANLISLLGGGIQNLASSDFNGYRIGGGTLLGDFLEGSGVKGSASVLTNVNRGIATDRLVAKGGNSEHKAKSDSLSPAASAFESLRAAPTQISDGDLFEEIGILMFDQPNLEYHLDLNFEEGDVEPDQVSFSLKTPQKQGVVPMMADIQESDSITVAEKVGEEAELNT